MNAATVSIRSYQPSDQAAVARLYVAGMLCGEPDRSDTAADLDFIQEAYFSQPADHFWVAEQAGRVVGTIGVVHDESIAQIRRLRVDPDLDQMPVAVALLDTALRHCRKHGSLKIVLDTRIEPAKAIQMLDASGFQYHRGKTVQGKEILEFYFNLYRKIDSDEECEATPAATPVDPTQPPAERPTRGRTTRRPIRVLLADDHEALRLGLVELLADEPDIEVIGEASDGAEAVELVRSKRPDLVVMDVSMPRLNGIEATRQIAQEMPRTRVIGLSMHEKHEVATSMLEAGATAYLPKDAPMELLLSAIRGERAAPNKAPGPTGR
jgi:CheY-like chemotaxis protein/N-acetylglutamate synthase-like GNAT family acetyltransferase